MNLNPLSDTSVSCLHRPSKGRTSPSRATRWRAASHRASPTPPSGAQWLIQAPNLRASPLTCRSPNGLSSPTSPCEPVVVQSITVDVKQSRGHPNFCTVAGMWMASHLWDQWRRRLWPGICTPRRERETRQQASSGDQPETRLKTPLPSKSTSDVFVMCLWLTGLTPWTWRLLKQRSTFLPAVTLSLSFTTRRWC